jgi:hypothetical protein
MVVCPESTAHEKESAVAAGYEQLQDGFEMFSHYVEFRPFDVIQHAQILACLSYWISGERNPEVVLPRRAVMCGDDPDVWTGKYRVSVTLKPPTDYVRALDSDTTAAHASLLDLFQNEWKSKKGTSWEEWRQGEASAYGTSQLAAYRTYLGVLVDIAEGRRNRLGNFPPPVVQLFESIFHEIRVAGVPESGGCTKMCVNVLRDN